MEARTQFTFYKSIWDSIQVIKKPADRAVAYDTICKYALLGEMPDLGTLPDAAAIVFISAKPNLDVSRRKAENGKNGGSKPKQTESKAKQTESKTEANASKQKARGKAKLEIEETGSEKEKEIEIELEKEIDISLPTLSFRDFEAFWEAYPKKVGKTDAQKSWQKIKGVSLDTLLKAIEAQKKSKQWQDRQYIPNPSTWLNQGRWMDEVIPDTGSKKDIPKGASGLGEAELAAIRRTLEQPVLPFDETEVDYG